MGGCTITKVADTQEEVLRLMEKAIKAAQIAGLEPDSELIVLREGDEVASIYIVTIEGHPQTHEPEDIKVHFAATDRGRAFHVGVAGHFGPKPNEGQFVGTIHVHT